MPWKERRVVDERMQFVMLHREGHHSMAELCKGFGISRKTGYKWVRRFLDDGPKGLEDLSRAHRHHPHAVSEPIWELLFEAKRENSTWGPKKIRDLVAKTYPHLTIPARSTVAKKFRELGLSKKRGRRRSVWPFSRPFGATRQPNATWCADYKGWFRTQDKERCEPLTITDAYSRYALCCEALQTTKYVVARPVFEKIFQEYGLPDAIRTDNGAPFAARGKVALSRMAVWWLKLDILPERIAPGHPEQNGRHERFHLTLKQDTVQPPKQNAHRQQIAFDAFRKKYNEIRPHEALGMKTPGEVYHPSNRPYPSRIAAIEYGRAVVVRKVRHNGEIKWNGTNIFVSELLYGEPVGLQQVTDRYWRIYFGRLQMAWVDDFKNKLLPPDSKKPGQEVVHIYRRGVVPHGAQHQTD